jgi:hypothetical protein
MPPGVRFCDLSSLIDFIYNGEVRIASQDLTSFMALAEQFKIKGLTEDKVKMPGKYLLNLCINQPTKEKLFWS